MRFIVEYRTDNYDEPEQYTIKDVPKGQVVARVIVSDFRAAVPVSDDFIKTRKGLVEAELRAIEYADHLAELLDEAVLKGELN